eukprot:scaffold36462_cov230-Isochrysis_galbana.AAC.1
MRVGRGRVVRRADQSAKVGRQGPLLGLQVGGPVSRRRCSSGSLPSSPGPASVQTRPSGSAARSRVDW